MLPFLLFYLFFIVCGSALLLLGEGGLVFVFLRFDFLILFVVLDCEHLIVLDAELEQFDCSFIIEC